VRARARVRINVFTVELYASRVSPLLIKFTETFSCVSVQKPINAHPSIYSDIVPDLIFTETFTGDVRSTNAKVIFQNLPNVSPKRIGYLEIRKAAAII